MNRLEFTATIVSALFWPAALVTVALLFRSHIRSLLPHVTSASIGPVSIEIERKIEAAAAAASTPVSPGQTSIIAQRLQRNAALLKGANILWVDDRPANNDTIASILSGYGAAVRRALDTEGALTALRAQLPDVVISDMERNGNREAGKELAERAIAVDRRLRPVFFVANLQPGVPHYAAGVTNRPDDLLHLVLDQLERVRAEP